MKAHTILPAFIIMSILLAGCGQERRLSTASPEALQLYTEGVGQLEKFYYPEAQTSFEKALTLDSSFAMAWARLAMVNAMNQNERAALADIGKATMLAPHATRREQLFISVWNNRLHFQNKQAARAVDSLIALYPDEKEAYMLRGNLFESSKEYDAAIRAYQKAIDTDTSYALAVMYLGYAYSAIGDQDNAITQMQRYIRLAPQAADPRASYADLLVRAGRYDEALEQYRKSLQLKPDYWYSVREIGTIYAIEGRLREAERQYHESATMVPRSPQLDAFYLSLDGNLNLLRRDYAAALGQYDKALRLDTVNGAAAFGTVYALGKLKRFDEGWRVAAGIKQEFERRDLTASPSMLGFHLMQARLLTEQGRYPDALAQCEQALDFSVPLTRTAVYNQMAEIYRRQRNYEAALDASGEALAINPNQPEALLTLVRIYHGRGDVRMAQEIGGRLLSLWKDADPDYGNLIELKGLVPVPGPA